MQYKILNSKIQIPEVQKNLIIRQHLLKKIDDLTQKMIIFRATVGYGKTILMSHYVRFYGKLCVWYRLDEMDNNMTIFFKYLCQAFAGVWDDFTFDVDVYSSKNVWTALEQLTLDFIIYLNEFLKRPEQENQDIILVLDDFQVIRSREIFRVIRSLMDYSGGNLKIFLATQRGVPEFVAAYLVRDEVRLVEMNELAFNQSEVFDVLKKILQRNISTSISESVYKIAEGWPAGTMFAAQHFKRNGDLQNQSAWDFISHDAFIQKYINNELFQKLPYDIQQFLVKTSVLDELCEDLCDYVMNRTDAGFLLNYILQENLFIFRINEKNGYYRYHSVFKMFLQHLIFPEQKKEILERSARWYLKKGNIDCALECWIKSDNSYEVAECLANFDKKLICEKHAGILEKCITYLSAKNLKAEISEDSLLEQLSKVIEMAGSYLGERPVPPDNSISVRLFGNFAVYVGKGKNEMSWRTKKTGELFAYLVCRRGRPVKRDELLKLLWPEDYPNNAVAMLHNMLYNIRRELAPYGQNERIKYVNKEYAMDTTGVTADLDEILRLCKAVENKDMNTLITFEGFFESYWGVFLDGMENTWCSIKKYYFEKCFLDGCALLGKYYIKAGKFSIAEKILKAGLGVDSYSEPMALMLMKCYTRSARRKEGKNLYEKLCKIYRSDLGISPSTKLMQAYEECIHSGNQDICVRETDGKIKSLK